MIVSDGSQILEITLREHGPEGTPAEGDLGLNITVTAREFSGRNDTVWVQGSEWRQFTEQLARLERQRSGQASIRAMSPNDFHLRIYASGNAGHMMATGWVGRDYTTRHGFLENRVSFGIEVDPGVLIDLLREFNELSAAS